MASILKKKYYLNGIKISKEGSIFFRCRINALKEQRLKISQRGENFTKSGLTATVVRNSFFYKIVIIASSG